MILATFLSVFNGLYKTIYTFFPFHNELFGYIEIINVGVILALVLWVNVVYKTHA
jgi:hypothetical protein